MLNVFMMVGALLLLSGTVAAFFNFKKYQQGLITGRMFWVIFGLGIIFAACSIFIVWPYDTNTRIVGFPFPAAAWQRSADGGAWADYVGIMTIPILIANGVCWAMSLQIPLYLWNRTR